NPGSNIPTWDPVHQLLRSIPFPESALGMTQLVGFSSSEGTGDTWLLSDGAINNGAYVPGSNWMLVRYTDYTLPPQVIASFNFFTSNGVTPFVMSPKDALFQYFRWTPMVQGDFDGDGASDVGFYASDAKGQAVFAYVLSREHYSQVRTLP